MDQQPNQPMTHVDQFKEGYQEPSQPISTKAKIVVIAMILGVLTLVIGGLLFVTSRKDPNVESARKLITIHAEISRVSQVVFDSEASSAKTKDFAAGVQAIAITHQNQATEIYGKFGGKLDKELAASGHDQANDDKLKQGELLDDMGSAYETVLKNLLSQANASIGEIKADPEIQAQLEEMAKSNEALFNAIAAPESS